MSECAIDFKIGDLVTLKSGGPIMTVEAVQGTDPKVSCVWFQIVAVLAAAHETRVWDSSPNRATFPQESLEAYPPPQQNPAS